MSGDEAGPVMLERRGAVAWLTLNRPAALNAMNAAMRVELPRLVREADRDPSVRVIVIRGAGERAFSVGADLKEAAEPLATIDYRQSRWHERWADAFDDARKPVIAAIRGHCLGGGLEIALACDLRVAATDATFGLPEVGLGVMTASGGSQRLPRLIGVGRAMDMILTGERIDATEAHRIGLVTRLTPPGDETALAETLATAIAAKPPAAVMFAKECVRKGGDMNLEAGMRLEVDLLSLLMASSDRLEAAAALREKRPPVFQGR